MSGATHAKHALTQRLEFMELQLNESKALVYVAGTDNKDKSDITNMRLDSLENRTYYIWSATFSVDPQPSNDCGLWFVQILILVFGGKWN